MGARPGEDGLGVVGRHTDDVRDAFAFWVGKYGVGADVAERHTGRCGAGTLLRLLGGGPGDFESGGCAVYRGSGLGGATGGGVSGGSDGVG